MIKSVNHDLINVPRVLKGRGNEGNKFVNYPNFWETPGFIARASNTAPIEITIQGETNKHFLQTGARVRIVNVTTNTAANGSAPWTVTVRPLKMRTITAASNATPIVCTTQGAHEYTGAEVVTVAGVGGNTAANGVWNVKVVSPTTFELVGSVGNGAYTSGGTASVGGDNKFTLDGSAGNGTFVGTGNYDDTNADPCYRPILGSCYWHAWIKYDDDAGGYIASNGIAGSHAVLFGVGTGTTPGSPVDGNVFGSPAGGSFTGYPCGGHTSIVKGQWTHIAVMYDETDAKTRVFVDGVCAGAAAGPVERWTGLTAGDADLNLFGPGDHNLANACIAWMAAFDFNNEVPNFMSTSPSDRRELAFVPELLPRQVMGAKNTNLPLAAHWIGDFTKGSLKDASRNGRNGVRHDGYSRNITQASDISLNGTNNISEAGLKCNIILDPTCPCREDNVRIAPLEASYTPASPPAGAIAFDSFQRPMQTYRWPGKASITLGSTESGSAGPLPWTMRWHPAVGAGSSHRVPFGIQDGSPVFLGDSAAIAYCNPGVSVGFELSCEAQVGSYANGSTALVFACDATGDNFRVVIMDRITQKLMCFMYVGGNITPLDGSPLNQFNIGAVVGTKLIVRGSDTGGGNRSIEVLIGSTSVATFTNQTTLMSNTRMGFAHQPDNNSYTSRWRWKNWTCKTFP